MTRTARFSQQARREIAQALRSMDHAGAQQALRFALEAAARRLGEHPQYGRAAPPYLPEPYRFWSLPRFATCWSIIRRQNRSRSSASYTPAVTCRKHSRSCGDLPAMPILSKTKSLVAIILCEINWLLHVRIAMFSPKASKVGQFQWVATDSN